MIQAYKMNQNRTQNVTDFIALALDKAASHIHQALKAMEEKDYEKRAYFSNLASEIVLGLKKYVPSLNLPSAKVSQSLEDYYKDLFILITRMNLKNDSKVAKAIYQSLQDISLQWRMLQPRAIEEKDLLPSLSLNPLEQSPLNLNA